MNTYGFIVGIEKYDEPTWDVPGPCTNAIGMARWLRSIDVPGPNIHLFLCSSRDLDKEVAGLEGEKVDLRLAGDAATIDTFWRKELTNEVPADSRLLVFWSGHGLTSAKRNRIFFCQDYQRKLPGRVFNGTNFLNSLLAPDYACFSDQIILADVCGVYDDAPVSETADALELARRNQLAFFATPEGEYAKGQEGRGVFTSTVLNVLRKSKGWPEQEPFADALEQALAAIGATPFRISGYRNKRQVPETVVGSVPEAAGNAYFHSLFVLLSDLDVVESTFRPHYLRTVTDLGNPELVKAQGLAGALKELSSLRDSDPGKTVPRGLLQFLVRLASEKALHQPVETWLETHAAGQKNTLADIRAKLELEAQSKILVIVTEVNGKENIAAYKPYLCNSDFSLVPDRTFERTTVSNWKQFEESLQKLLAGFVVHDRLSNLELHFVADPPLFDRRFHMLRLAPGRQPIGEDVVVVVRHKQRILSADQKLKRAWQECAEMLRAKKPAALKWLKLASKGELPGEKGLFFATFTLPEPVAGKPSSRTEKDIVWRLLKLGIPYIYLPHSGPEAGNWGKLQAALTKLLARKATLGEFPATLLDERIRGSKIASGGTIIWDDPAAVPFSTTEGVRFG